MLLQKRKKTAAQAVPTVVQIWKWNERWCEFMHCGSLFECGIYCCRTLTNILFWMRLIAWCRARGENSQRGVSLRRNYLISKNARLRQSSELNQPCRMTLWSTKIDSSAFGCSSLGALTTTLHVFASVFHLLRSLKVSINFVIKTIAGKWDLEIWHERAQIKNWSWAKLHNSTVL